MIFLPKQLGEASLDPETLKKDRKGCRRFGPCGIGDRALYLNSFYLDRRYYVPVSSVRRIYKRIAMSKGGFTGKGLFASIPYLVVEYDSGQEKQCIFKEEDAVDRMISCFHAQYPDIPTHSRKGQQQLEEKKKEQARKQELLENCKDRELVRQLSPAIDYLEAKSELYEELSRAARRKRTQEQTNPAYRYAALAIVLLGAAAFGYGIFALIHHMGGAMYFLLFGLAAVFLFAGANVLPTGKNNAAYIQRRLDEAQKAMDDYIAGYPDFPVPSVYAHPIVLRRMQEVIAAERAETIPDALEVVKDDLRSMDSSVTVDQDTYEEIMAVKPLFLVRNWM